ncbi:hypothetical protein PCE1_002455 [Barthelona sp. PCE]
MDSDSDCEYFSDTPIDPAVQGIGAFAEAKEAGAEMFEKEDAEIRGDQVTIELTLPDQTVKTIEIAVGQTVEFVRYELERKFQVDSAQIKIMYNDKTLPDPLTIIDLEDFGYISYSPGTPLCLTVIDVEEEDSDED